MRLLEHVDEWQGDGVWTPEADVAWRTGVSPSTATKVVNVARRIHDFPHCVAMMERGELSLDQMAPIVRHVPGWADRQMSGLATRLTTTQISEVARDYPWAANEWGRPIESTDTGTGAGTECDDALSNDAGSAVDDAGSTVDTIGPTSEAPIASEPSDDAWFGWDDHGRFRLQLNVGADSGMILETALNECRDHLFHSRTDTDSTSTVEAVLEMADRSLDAVDSPDRRGRFRECCSRVRPSPVAHRSSDSPSRPDHRGHARKQPMGRSVDRGAHRRNGRQCRRAQFLHGTPGSSSRSGTRVRDLASGVVLDMAGFHSLSMIGIVGSGLLLVAGYTGRRRANLRPL